LPARGNRLYMSDTSKQLADTAGFELLGHAMGKDVESSIIAALEDGAVFLNSSDPPAIFRQALAASIRNIESHPRGTLFQEFLLKGPYEDAGDIPTEVVNDRISDDNCAAAIAFIYSHMVNCFKGAVTELFAVKSCLDVLGRLQRKGDLPPDAKLYVGDSVAVHKAKGKGLLKGADQHILIKDNESDGTSIITVAGLTEVKSYIQSDRRLREQLDKHLLRAKRGLRVIDQDYCAEKIKTGYGNQRRIVRITVLPGTWKLPRSFRFIASKNGRILQVDPGEPPREENEIQQIDNDEWRITLRWSQEALAEAAYEMTFWYMEKVGEVIYSEFKPKEWEEMTPAQAGQNAAKMMLYYAILRCRTGKEEQRAIALYNTYSYGYAIGMNYKNTKGRREMLWPQDLDEIHLKGRTKNGCALH
jgi:hypothetical protein